jgi:hypothetical protein
MARSTRPCLSAAGPRSHARSALFVALLAGLTTVGGSACYVEEEGPPAAYADGYAPQYYDGYVVYYDQVGHPYYYANGAVFWVPPASPFYFGLVNHWRYHRDAYYRWYGNRGYRYRAYRRR